MKKYNKELNKELIEIVVVTILLMFIIPWFSFVIGWVVGWCSKLFIGNYIVNAFALFGITITKNDIPLIGGALAWLGSFFKTSRKPDK